MQLNPAQMLRAAKQMKAVEIIAMLVDSKSMHMCLAYMQTTVTERAVSEVVKKLKPDVKMCQELGNWRFLEEVTAAQQNQPLSKQTHKSFSQ
ncbi:unnamed protein product [Mesocestoides corti]|uniref:Uncharacterized protein n=1 Tax=Mesocestoides corti TaxID=53468 RepID=A0A0R3UDK1_MESCO|nr:unnamed protein product [Mesocestoides corti]